MEVSNVPSTQTLSEDPLEGCLMDMDVELDQEFLDNCRDQLQWCGFGSNHQVVGTKATSKELNLEVFIDP